MKPKGPTKGRFEEIFAKGRRVGGTLARIAALPGTGLVGIATSKKIGGKPERNRAKRRFREAIRVQPDLANPRLDFIVTVTPEGAVAEFASIQNEVRSLFVRVAERWESELESS